MTNQEISKLFRNIAAAYSLLNVNRFKIIAYEKASDTILHSSSEVEDLWRSGKLDQLPGIGTTLTTHLNDLFKFGKVKHWEQIFSKIPESVFLLLDIPGFGPKKAYKLVTELKLLDSKKVVEGLIKAAKADKIAQIEGFGKKSQELIVKSLERYKEGQVKEKRILLAQALSTANEIISFLKLNKDTVEVHLLGSLRRMVYTIGDIDLAVSTYKTEEVLNWFLSYPKKATLIEKGPKGASILLNNGMHVDLRVQSPISFGSMLQYFTGSKNHNIHLRELALKKGLSLSEYGIKPLRKVQSSKFKVQSYNKKLNLYEFAREDEFYNSIGIPWIPPELREDSGEIEAGQAGQLPKLIEPSDIKGDLHIHSSYNLQPSHDLGSSTVETLINNADRLNYDYIGISDHNPSHSNHTESQIISILKRRKAYFEQIKQSIKSVRVQLFIMLEVDILPDGKLPLPVKAFDYLDAVIVSIHSSFNMDKQKITERILSGLSHPKAKILAHPTGRLIAKREGYDAEWDLIYKYCRDKNKAIEINSCPERLDLPDFLIREAVKQKVKLVIDTDSHDVSQMENILYGISQARRGWATKHDIINTLSYKEIKSWLNYD